MHTVCLHTCEVCIVTAINPVMIKRLRHISSQVISSTSGKSALRIKQCVVRRIQQHCKLHNVNIFSRRIARDFCDDCPGSCSIHFFVQRRLQRKKDESQHCVSRVELFEQQRHLLNALSLVEPQDALPSATCSKTARIPLAKADYCRS